MSRSLATPSFGPPRTPSPTGAPTLRGVAYPSQRQVDAVVYDVLLIEMVRSLRESASVARKRERELEEEMTENGLIEKTVTAATETAPATTRDSVSSVPAAKAAVDEDEEAVRVR
ncbi:hypothetical protein FRC12_024280, partial [Ceratobasidium sp. 428]